MSILHRALNAAFSIACVALASISTGQLFAQIHINCGGGASGIYAPDNSFNGGQAYVATIPFPAGAPEYLRTSRGGTFGYSFSVPDGAYAVTLHFFESSSAITGPAQRNFNVTLNGNVIIPSLDLFAAVGLNTGLVKTFGVTASGGGGIALLFSTLTRNAVVSAIDIMPAAQPPGQLVGTSLKLVSNYDAGITVNGLTYLLPKPTDQDTTGMFIQDAGIASCGNVDPDVKATVCHQLVWAALP